MTSSGPAIGSRETAALIERHLPLVEQIVLSVSMNFPRHVDRKELVSAGVLGLVEAASRYEPSREVPFDRFAGRRIRGAVLDTVRAADWAPRSVRADSRRAESAEQKLASQLGRMPTMEEVAAEIGSSVADLVSLRDRVHRSVVLALEYRPSDAEDDLTLGDLLGDDGGADPSEALEAKELRAFLRDAVDLLPERHRLIVVGYYLEGRTSAELARLLGVTESRVSQLRTDALTMLREGIEAQFRPSNPEPPSGRAARRRASYAAAISTRSTWKARLDEATATPNSGASNGARPAPTPPGSPSVPPNASNVARARFAV